MRETCERVAMNSAIQSRVHCSVFRAERSSGASQMRVAPLLQAVGAVVGLFGVGARLLFEPVAEESVVLLEEQELAEHDVRLRERTRNRSVQFGSVQIRFGSVPRPWDKWDERNLKRTLS